MTYLTSDGMRLIVNTTLKGDQITTVIETSGAEIDKRRGSQSASDKLIKKLSMLLTAYTVKTRQPQSQAIGEYSEDAGDVPEVWEQEIESIYRLYRTPKITALEYHAHRQVKTISRGVQSDV